jgi:hypothetical protein
MENFNAMASYSLIEQTANTLSIEHIKVSYDVKSAAAECEKRDRLDWVHFLTTGRRV